MSTETSPSPSDPTEPLPTQPLPTQPLPAQPSLADPAAAGRAPTSTAPTAPGSTTTAGTTQTPVVGRRRVSVSDVVWGGLFVVIGLGLLARAVGLRYDTELALIIGLALGGLALVGTALVTGARRR